MPKTRPILDEFLAALPADRRDTMTTLHKAIRKAVPKLAPAMMSGMGPSPIIGYGNCCDQGTYDQRHARD